MNEPQEQPNRQPDPAPEQPAVDTEPTVIFVSDSHFHLEPNADEAARLEQFLLLLDDARAADHLVLLGDIFDFWFDFQHFRLKGYESLLSALDGVRGAGTEIHFIGGNHDIWAADYFHQRYGCSRDGAAQTIQFGSRRVLLTHGDGLLKFDWAYNSFRAMVRTRVGIAVAKSLHPELLYHFSTWLSGHSRGATRDEASALDRLAQRWFERQTDPPWDLMIMGHIHHGYLLQRGPRQLAALAGWFDPLSYGLLRGGQFQLLDFSPEQRPDLG